MTDRMPAAHRRPNSWVAGTGVSDCHSIGRLAASTVRFERDPVSGSRLRQSREAARSNGRALQAPPGKPMPKHRSLPPRADSTGRREVPLPVHSCLRTGPWPTGNRKSQNAVLKSVQGCQNGFAALPRVKQGDRSCVVQIANGDSHPPHSFALVPDDFDHSVKDGRFVRDDCDLRRGCQRRLPRWFPAPLFSSTGRR